MWAFSRRAPATVPTLPDLEPQALYAAFLEDERAHWQGEMAGELTPTSVIYQARLTRTGRIRGGDVTGAPGVGAFLVARDPAFHEVITTSWGIAEAANDFVIRRKITGLEPATEYYVRLLSGSSVGELRVGPVARFRTPGGRGSTDSIRFAVVTGMNRFAFRAGLARERNRGFPALDAIREHGVDFLIATGDNVYYDSPYFSRARDWAGMRAKWHRQFAVPRFERFLLRVPVYWQKDDHDYRYNDADPYGELEPSHELGVAVFREQVPVVDPADPDAETYRTHRLNDLLQVWLLEGRDYRDANTDPPSPQKSLWGAKQKAWLQRTLLESDATFKIISSPTPMIGPDDATVGKQGGILSPFFGGAAVGQEGDTRKRDNHTNEYGFKDEGEAFFRWLAEHDFRKRNVYLVCGDRHWRYHSIQPDGFEEFSAGAIIDRNSRPGIAPGDPEGTDPEGHIRQPYLQTEKGGGFLEVTVYEATETNPARCVFAFFDKSGRPLYTVEREDRSRGAATAGDPARR
jgi:alkaline phosphatase/alkaline phosphatase D